MPAAVAILPSEKANIGPSFEFAGQSLPLDQSMLEVIDSKHHVLHFSDGEGRRLSVFTPRDGTTEKSGFADISLNLRSMRPQSHADLLARLYGATPSGFRWSMSRDELHDLEWYLGQRVVMFAENVNQVYVRQAKDWSGILIFRGKKAEFLWTHDAALTAGSIFFETPDAGKVDWILDFCSRFQPGKVAVDRDERDTEINKFLSSIRSSATPSTDSPTKAY